MEFKITDETVNKVLNYLGAQPYVEVVQLIQTLSRLEPIKVKERKSNEKK